MIQDREKKMEEIKHSVELSKVSKWITNVRITGVVDM